MTTDILRKLAGKVIMAGFDGTALPSSLMADCENGALGGVIVFKRNVESVEQVAAMLGEIRKRAPRGEAPLIGVDQEGGRVIRIGEPLSVLPPAQVFGKIDDPSFTEFAGRLVASELRALGFTVNFAPVLDVNTNPDSPIIGDRSYSGDVQKVISHGLAFARGHKDAGVFPCAKHFPGHGDANVDSHVGLPVVTHPIQRLESVEMEPFAAWVRTGLGPVMTAHIIFPALDESNTATVSREILTTILRSKLHFNGVIFTDDLEMGAIADHGGAANMAVKIIRAGADGLLICRSEALRQEVMERLIKEATVHPDFAQKLERSAARLSPLAYPSGPRVDLSWIGSDAHLEMQSRLAARFKREGV